MNTRMFRDFEFGGGYANITEMMINSGKITECQIAYSLRDVEKESCSA